MADVTETRQLYDPQLTGSRTALLSSVDKFVKNAGKKLNVTIINSNDAFFNRLLFCVFLFIKSSI